MEGQLLPGKIKEQEMLAFYGEQLSAVEINSTFYRMPRREVLHRWVDDTPDQFRFIIKASRRITHFKRLGDAGEPMRYLLNNIETLGKKLGAVLFQLPPNMRCSLDRQDDFLKLVPQDLPISFEFRDQSWFVEDVVDRLNARNIAICHSDHLELPFSPTADWGYLRLRRPKYDKRILQEWTRRMTDAGWRDAYVFFRHETEGTAPQLAAKFADLSAGD